MNKTLFAIALTLIGAQAAQAQWCTLDLKLTDIGQSRKFELSFARVPNATGYIIEETVDGSTSLNHFEVSQDAGATRFTRTFERQTTYNLNATYRVIATGVANCSGEKIVQYKLDPNFKKAMVRSVIPLVGSTPGANGAQFKTSLRLRSPGGDLTTGKLVFHPIGVPSTPADPSINYRLAGSDSKQEWDDIVAAFGATGLGTIDIVPDPVVGDVNRTQMVPSADVRLFNVTPNGTFGTLEVQTQPFSFHKDNPEADAGLRVTVPTSELRLNIGVRTFLDSEIDVVVMRNGESVVNRTFNMVGDLLQFVPAAAFVGSDVQAGDEIFVRVRGAGVPIYSLTDNTTNDPALFVPPAEIDRFVDKYQILD
ncbi:MAG TPA: hypothetical protein VF608_11500 [Thermoanaerobaculia bacterium]